MQKLLKNNKGVTLIALVVTIVILIILAAVSMTMVLGNNGIFEQAKKGANSMASAEANTQEGFNSMSAEIDKIISGNGSSEQPQAPEESKTIEEAKNSGKEFTEPKTEVADSKGNKVVIPGGFKVAEDSGDTVQQGIVIEDVSASGDDNIKGSQFVWIPVGTFVKDDGSTSNEIVLGRYKFNVTDKRIELVQAAYTEENAENYEQKIELGYFDRYMCIEIPKYRQGILDSSNRLNDLNATAKDLAGFVKSTKDNGGYYIARYEASFASGSSAADYTAASKKSIANSEFGMNYSPGVLWNYIMQFDASTVSINTYKNAKTVKSDLMNSYVWNTAIVYIEECGNKNYAYQESRNSKLSNTGTNNDEVCKINDMASNIVEWTTEYSNNVSTSLATPCSFNGGDYTMGSTFSRGNSSVSYKEKNIGFRYYIYM